MKMQIVWRDFGSSHYCWVASCPALPDMPGQMGPNLPRAIAAMQKQFQDYHAS
jgi:hypothetical protein